MLFESGEELAAQIQLPVVPRALGWVFVMDVSDWTALKRQAGGRNRNRKGSLSFLKYPHLLATAWNVLPSVREAISVKHDLSESQLSCPADNSNKQPQHFSLWHAVAGMRIQIEKD